MTDTIAGQVQALFSGAPAVIPAIRSGQLRETFGPGWRMYYLRQGTSLILMLGGGDKGSQERDIELAKALAKELQNEQGPD